MPDYQLVDDTRIRRTAVSVVWKPYDNDVAPHLTRACRETLGHARPLAAAELSEIGRAGRQPKMATEAVPLVGAA